MTTRVLPVLRNLNSTSSSLATSVSYTHLVKVLTGDNDLVTRKVCSEVGIHAEKILIGSQVETMSDPQLAEAVETMDVFARLSPAHKKRIVQALQQKGHVVGFMGDGINCLLYTSRCV